MVWIYTSNGGSVFATILYHTIDNVSWILFPRGGSHYAPEISGPLTALVAAIAAALSRLDKRRDEEYA